MIRIVILVSVLFVACTEHLSSHELASSGVDASPCGGSDDSQCGSGAGSDGGGFGSGSGWGSGSGSDSGSGSGA